MKEITIYECEDGTRFDSKTKALEYEKLCSDVGTIMCNLEPRTDDCEDGKCFIQQNVDSVRESLKKFLLLCSEKLPLDKKTFTECANGTRHISHASYLLSDYGIDIFKNTMFRFSCTNMESGREYQQPYYAKHEDEFKGYYND